MVLNDYYWLLRNHQNQENHQGSSRNHQNQENHQIIIRESFILIYNDSRMTQNYPEFIQKSSRIPAPIKHRLFQAGTSQTRFARQAYGCFIIAPANTHRLLQNSTSQTHDCFRTTQGVINNQQESLRTIENHEGSLRIIVGPSWAVALLARLSFRVAQSDLEWFIYIQDHLY